MADVASAKNKHGPARTKPAGAEAADLSAHEAAASTADELELRDFLSFRIAKVHAKLNTQAMRLLAAHAGLTLQQWRVLLLIGSQTTTTASALSQTGEIDKALVSRTLKALVADGLVLSRPDRTDHRQLHLKLSAAGRRLHERMLPIMRQRQQRLLDCLTARDRIVVYTALEKLEQAATDDVEAGEG